MVWSLQDNCPTLTVRCQPFRDVSWLVVNWALMNIKFHQILHFTSTGKNISLFSHASTESYFIEQQLLVSIYLPIYLCIYLSIHLSIFLNNVERCRNQCEHSSFKLKRTTFGVFRPHDLQIDTGAKSPKHLRCAKLFGQKKQTKMENPIPS